MTDDRRRDVPDAIDEIADRTPPLGFVDDPVQRRVNDRLWQRIELEARDRKKEDDELGDKIHQVKNKLTSTIEEVHQHDQDDSAKHEAAGKVATSMSAALADLQLWRRDVDLIHAVMLGSQRLEEPGRLGRLEQRMQSNEGKMAAQDAVIAKIDKMFWKIIVAATTGATVAGVAASLLLRLF